MVWNTKNIIWNEDEWKKTQGQAMYTVQWIDQVKRDAERGEDWETGGG
jgi:hypothetical protein